MKKKNAVFEDIITTVSRYFVVLVVVVIVCIALSGIKFVKSGEVAVILRFGKLVGDTTDEQIHEPGILFAFPYVVDEVVTVQTGSVIERTVTTYYTEGNVAGSIHNGYLVTGDSNIAIMSVAVKYSISDPVNYALRIKDSDKIIDASVSNAMLESAARINFNDILTSGKEQFNKSVLDKAQNNIDNNNIGVTINSIEFVKVAPADDVKESFDKVNDATINAAKTIEEANQYKTKVLSEANATAEKLIADANTNYSQKTSAANADLVEFWGTLEAYEKSDDSREYVRERIRNDKLSSAIGKIGKVIAVKDGDSHIIIN